jgi:hypothetical protein
MTRRLRLALWIAPVFVLASAGAADAQVAHTFDELAVSGRLKPGDKVVLSGPRGERAIGRFRGWRSGSLELSIKEEKRDAVFAEKDVLEIRRTGTHGLAWGVAIGAASAVVATAAAASSYGENEGGEFCGGCFLRWSAISIPVGVGVGAGIGLALDALRRETLYLSSLKSFKVGVTTVVTSKSAGVRVAVVF